MNVLSRPKGPRRSALETLDQPALQASSVHAYEFCEWRKVRVHIDYHIELERHYHSVPYILTGKQLMARYSANTVELLHPGERVVCHPRSHRHGPHSTVTEALYPLGP